MEKLILKFLFQVSRFLRWKKLFNGPLDNNKGQTLITWLVLLSVILLMTISFGSAFVLLQDRMHIMSVCRLESLKTQGEVEPLIKKLFALNPQSKNLRLLMFAAKSKLAVSLANLNFSMAAQARLEIAKIRSQQRALDSNQRMLVHTANLKLHVGTFTTYSKLKSVFTGISEKNKAWAETTFVLGNPRIPKLAVKREDDQLAPVYFPRNDFEKLQTTSQSWKQKYALTGLLKKKLESQSQCNATLEENSWVPKIRRDKLSSR